MFKQITNFITFCSNKMQSLRVNRAQIHPSSDLQQDENTETINPTINENNSLSQIIPPTNLDLEDLFTARDPFSPNRSTKDSEESTQYISASPNFTNSKITAGINFPALISDELIGVLSNIE